MKYLLFLLLTFTSQFLCAQELAKFNVQIEEERIDAPVSVSLDGINYNTDKGNLVLYEITGSEEKAVPSQIEAGHSAQLWFILNGVTVKNSERNFVLKREDKTVQNQSMVSLKKDHKDLSLLVNG